MITRSWINMIRRYFLIGAAAALAAGCDANGSVQFFLAAEDSIPSGLDPGNELDQVQDGWRVRYQKFLLAVGNVRAHRNIDPATKLSDPRVHVADMRNLPPEGIVISEFQDIAAVQWDKVGFDIPRAKSGAVKARGISDSDYDLMIKNGYSLYVEGTIEKENGQSCRPTMPTDCVLARQVKLVFGVAAGTSFDDCAPEQGDVGFAVPSGATAQVKPTIHGDHWFFTNLTHGAEVTRRRAQWIADADLDRDGTTTEAEMKMVKASDVFPSPTYNLSGALVPIATAWDYLVAQKHTLGDYQGDGECPSRTVLP